MQELRTILRRHVPVDQLAAVEPSLETLVTLPATAKIAEAVETCRRLLETLPDEARAARLRVTGDLVQHERRLVWAERRDAVQRSRPPGCWCLGLGGRHRAYLHDPLADSGVSDVPAYREYCGCPDGAAAFGRAAAERERIRQAALRDRLNRLWEIADLPPHYADFSLDSYPVSAATAPVLARLREWQQSDRWLYLWGPTGTGKTGLAFGLMRELMAGGRPVIFITVPDLLARIRASWDAARDRRDEAREEDIIAGLRRIDVLVMDDWGAEPPARDWSDAVFYRLINDRLGHHRQTIVTSNLAPDELAGHLGGLAGERIVWRVVEMCQRFRGDPAPYVLHLDGPNLRDR